MGPSFAFMQKRYARSVEQQKSLLESRLLAVRTGLEPATLGVTGRYSNQLSYFRATNCGVPTGIRTPVIAVKGRCPRPLDDGDVDTANVTFLPYFELVEVCGIEPQTSCMPCKRSPS